MSTPNYDINYNDERFKNVESEKDAQLNEINNTYNNMINQTDSFYQNQINATNDYANKQQQLQQDRTNFTIEQINQNKEKVEKDYTREQKGAYVDWQKQSNQYGANAEMMATNGLNKSGYSESSQVSMYNTYQNRISSARETYNNAVLNYDNAIKDAQLQNNSALAEIAFNALKTQLELSLEGFQYKNTLLLDQIDKKQAISDTYYARYRDVVNQINQENTLKENVRQYNANMAFKEKQAKQEQKNWEREYALTKSKVNASIASSAGGSSSIKKSSTGNNDKLSANAQRLYDTYEKNKDKKLFPLTSLTPGSTSAQAKANAINQLRKTNQITDNDVRILVKKLGLE